MDVEEGTITSRAFLPENRLQINQLSEEEAFPGPPTGNAHSHAIHVLQLTRVSILPDLFS